MAVYDCAKGKSTTGGDITVSVGFTHEQSELRCLALSNVKDEYQWKIVDAGNLTQVSEGVYRLAYPFSTTGQAWTLYIWRKTKRTDDVVFDGTRIPIEAIITKLIELSDKADETAHENERAVRTPECDGTAFLPPKDVRAGELMGFDEDGNPAVGKNVEAIKEIYEARDAAKASADDAAESAEAAANSATNAHNSAVEAAGYVVDMRDTVQGAYDAAASAQASVEAAASSAESAAESAEAAAESAESAALNATAAKASETAITNALTEAEAGGLVLDVPVATSLIYGKVKLSTDEVIDALSDATPLYGLVGKNSDGQLVVPCASTEQGGVVSIGESSAITLDEDGCLVLDNAKVVEDIANRLPLATVDTLGTIKLGGDETIIIYTPGSSATASHADKTAYAAPVQLTETGQAGVKLASLTELGTVMLGSRFQPTNDMPYVVGIGASNNSGKVGQLAFNLAPTQSDGTDGCLKYRKSSSSSESSTEGMYEMFVEDATTTQRGVVTIAYDLYDPDTENGVPLASVVKTAIAKLKEELTGFDVEAYENHITDTTRHFVPFDIVDEDGDPTQVFYISGEAQTVELTVNRYLQMLIEPEIIAGADWMTLDENATSRFMNEGVLAFTVTAINPEMPERSGFISIRFAQGAYPIEIVQQRSVGSTDAEVLANADEITVSTEDVEA